MTYQYMRLAIYRLPRFNHIEEIVLCDQYGTILPPECDYDKFVKYGAKKIESYTVDEFGTMYANLKGVTA